MELEHHIIKIYLRIDEVYKEITGDNPLRKRGFQPALSDAEVLTMEIVGEMEGRNSDHAIWRYFRDHWHGWFPKLSAYKTFAKHCANLCWIKQKILRRLFPATDNVHIVDGVPMPVCHNARAYRSRMLGDVAAWGYCAAKKEHYYGLRGHVVINSADFISVFVVTPANIGERQCLWEIADQVNGMLIGDKGFIGEEWRENMALRGIDLQTPLRKNMVETRPKWAVRNLYRVRKRVETAISLLTGKFAITKIKAHDIWHFTSKLYRKLLAYNFYIAFRAES